MNLQQLGWLVWQGYDVGHGRSFSSILLNLAELCSTGNGDGAVIATGPFKIDL